ncbi:hypothetical protein ACHAXS_000662 [Conticribra weissflogii]
MISQCRRHGDWKDGPVRDRNIPHHKGMWKTASNYLLAFSAAKIVGQPPPMISNSCLQVSTPQRARKSFLCESYLHIDQWSDVQNTLEYGSGPLSAYLSVDCGVGSEFDHPMVDIFSPHILSAKTRNEEAMYGPFASEYWDACVEELNTLVNKLDAWELVERPSNPDIIIQRSLWAFQCKRLPDGSVKKFKARFCVDGSKQCHGIDYFASWLPVNQVWICWEDTAEGFLGVDIACRPNPTKGEPDQIILTQPGLTKRIIDGLGLHASHTSHHDTPAECSPLPKDVNGSPAIGSFNYASVNGMSLYLSGHSCPEIAFAVHQCARYTFQPTCHHELALIRLGRYLKVTIDKGLILTPSFSSIIPVDCFPDADFAGLYSHEDSEDPHCVRSWTGFVILVANCPILWKSKLQTEIALLTMEAEYVALSHSCKRDFSLSLILLKNWVPPSVSLETKLPASMSRFMKTMWAPSLLLASNPVV